MHYSLMKTVLVFLLCLAGVAHAAPGKKPKSVVPLQAAATQVAKPEPVVEAKPAYPPAFKMVAAGNEHFVALDKTGGLWVFGEDCFHCLGLGDENEILFLAGERMNRKLPELLGTGFIFVTAHDAYTLAVKEDGTLWGWGRHVPGLEYQKDYLQPELISRIPIKEVYSGKGYALGVNKRGQAWYFGRVFDPEPKNLYSPVPAHLWPVISLSASPYHAAAVLNDKTAWTVGKDNRRGTLGKTPRQYSSESQIGGDNHVSVSTGELFTQLNREDGTSEFLGDMAYLKPYLGKIISEKKNSLVVETPYKSIVNYEEIPPGTGKFSVYLLKKDGDLDMIKLVITSGKAEIEPPVKVASGFSEVAGSYRQFIGLKSDGTIWVWGRSYKGLAGLKDKTEESDIPLPVEFR